MHQVPLIPAFKHSNRSGAMNRRQTKKKIVELLLNGDLSHIQKELSKIPENSALNALFSCLCHPEEAVRWHAVTAFGFIVAGIAGTNLEEARIVMRRFLWMLNDESGGIGWGIPEAMAEVMLHSRPLANEYLHMLVSYTMDDGPEMFQDGNFLELDRLQAGVLWGLCRVASNYPDELDRLNLENNLDVYFQSTNGDVRGLVNRLVGILKLGKFRVLCEKARADQASVRYYLDGAFSDTTVGALAESALENLE